MDAETAIKKMREKYQCYIKLDVWKSESARLMQEECNEIADFIEKQSKEIAGLIDDNGQQHIEIMLLSRKDQQQAKYAELGRLAVQSFDKLRCLIKDRHVCSCCNWSIFCQQRAELIEVEEKK